MEVLLELLFEFLIQLAGEVLVEFGFQSLREPFRKTPNPWLAALGYAIFGASLGAVSLLVFPRHQISDLPWRQVNLILTPIAVGGCMAAIGAWRARREQPLLRLDRFSYGYLFALCFALVRFFWADSTPA